MSETDNNATTDTASQVDAQDDATPETPAGEVNASETGADAATETTTDADATKGDDTDKGEDAEKKAEKDDKGGEVPEAYEFTAPEGVEIDQGLMDRFTPFAKEQNWTQEQAAQVFDFYAKEALPLIQTAQAEAWASQTAQWVEDAKSDKEIGGDKFEENMGVAKAALDRFATPEFVEFLNSTGMGNHPEMIRAFHKIGKSISDDAFHTAGGNSAGDVDPAKRLFPDMN